jgi:hypothetical protein
MIFPVFLSSWIVSIALIAITTYVFENPSTRLIPEPLRHTWVAGVSSISAFYIGLVLPYVVLGEYLLLLGSLIFVNLFLATVGKTFYFYIIEDLRIHKKEDRGLFRHSEECYMANGNKRTFADKVVSYKLRPENERHQFPHSHE